MLSVPLLIKSVTNAILANSRNMPPRSKNFAKRDNLCQNGTAAPLPQGIFTTESLHLPRPRDQTPPHCKIDGWCRQSNPESWGRRQKGLPALYLFVRVQSRPIVPTDRPLPARSDPKMRRFSRSPKLATTAFGFGCRKA
jgi:hypothetical protein